MKNWRYQHNWSPAELQAVGDFARKSLAKLRRLQDVVRQQIPMAHKIRDPEKQEFIIWRLQRMGLILSAAVDKKCFE